MTPRIHLAVLSSGISMLLASCLNAPLHRIEDPDHAVVLGRCVDEQGRPLAGCEIHITYFISNATMGFDPSRPHFAFEEVQRWEVEDENLELVDPLAPEDLSWTRPYHVDRHFLTRGGLETVRSQGRFYQRLADAVTDADGRFRVSFPTEDDSLHCHYTMFTWSSMRAPARGGWGNMDPGEVKDMGTMRLPRGHRVRGTVVDDQGVGVVGAKLRIRAINVRATTSAGGSYAFSEPIPPGKWEMAIWGRGIHEKRVTVTVEDRTWQHATVVRARH